MAHHLHDKAQAQGAGARSKFARTFALLYEIQSCAAIGRIELVGEVINGAAGNGIALFDRPFDSAMPRWRGSSEG